MNARFKIFSVFLALSIGVLFLVSPIQAATPIAKITTFKGEVLIQRDKKLIKVTQIDQILNEGDRIQTKEGEAQVAFNDGAAMKVSPFTNAQIHERTEERGWWVFKTKEPVRRLTIFVGKLWFKSGISKRNNYLQTPTAVCGLRGSEAEGGFDNTRSLLNVISGLTTLAGPWTQGPFANPGADAALRNLIFQRVENARAQLEKAEATGDQTAIAAAQVAALDVVIAAAQILQTNPDEKVKAIAGAAADAAKKEKEVIIKTTPAAATTSTATTAETTAAPTTVKETTTSTTTSTTTTTAETTTTSTTTTATTSTETTVSP